MIGISPSDVYIVDGGYVFVFGIISEITGGKMPGICQMFVALEYLKSAASLLVIFLFHLCLGPPSMLCVLVQVDHSTARSMGMRSYNHTSCLKKVNLLGILRCYLVTSQSSAWI